MITIREIDQDIEVIRDMCAEGQISGEEMFLRIEQLKKDCAEIIAVANRDASTVGYY